MPYYIEYFARPEEVPLATFHTRVKEFYEEWAQRHPEDRLELLLGRTWRLGPRPPYLALWRFESFARLDAWQDALRETLTDDPFMVVRAAGVYEDLGQELP